MARETLSDLELFGQTRNGKSRPAAEFRFLGEVEASCLRGPGEAIYPWDDAARSGAESLLAPP
jgi:hypothetical protein